VPDSLAGFRASLLAGEPRVLIARLSAIGDCLQTLPLACALKDRFPRAHVTWAVEKGAAPLVAACRAVDRVVVVPKGFLTSPAAGWQVRQQLAPLGIQIVLDPQSLSKSSAIGWLSQAPWRIGFAAPTGREISPWLNNDLVASRRLHMVERYLELLAPLGIENPAVDFGLRRDRNAGQMIDQWLAKAELGEAPAVVNPGAGWDSKRWPVERFAAVAEHLGRRWNLPTAVVWAGPRERAWAEEIVRLAGGHARLMPATSLVQLMELLRRARLMVAADTGPLHLAAAVGTPCLGLFGPTSREECGPYGTDCDSLQRAQDRSRSRKHPGADNWAMREITVKLAQQACDDLLAKQAPAPVGLLPVAWNVLPVARQAPLVWSRPATA
jgi:ADP-heptose:LPS heptosyltransferase